MRLESSFQIKFELCSFPDERLIVGERAPFLPYGPPDGPKMWVALNGVLSHFSYA
jgi:hypothetical protein